MNGTLRNKRIHLKRPSMKEFLQQQICRIQESMRKIWTEFPHRKILEVNRLYIVSISKYQQYLICELITAFVKAI